ncbi:MAG TPA: ABC transporter substrate-binding protein [Candidatus Sulfotelmatobacter sp.]|nr:ABC transporter substrate-binding protein [Candidatus Sulfotelmatobacter sp.]
MIFLKRRRLLVWLFRAYLKKWRKTIFLSFIFGLIVFFILRYGINYFTPLIPFTQKETIGKVGAYTSDSLPYEIVSRLSVGLTKIDEKENIIPSVAKSWEIKDNGKKYIFYLNKNIYFNDGTRLTSDKIKYNFIDVTVERPNEYVIIFNLKNRYSPFLVTVSRPIFKSGFVGVGEYKVSSINLNGSFVQSINLVSNKSQTKEISYLFYPTEESLKTAFLLGEVSKISNLKSTTYNGVDLKTFKNSKVSQKTDFNQLVTVFYNTQDPTLSDKRLREALSYSMPDNFAFGKRNYGPFSPNSWVSESGLSSYQQDFEHAKILLGQSDTSTKSSKLNFEIKTLPQYIELSKVIQKDWEKIGIKTKITVVDSLPLDFQIFLGDFNVPMDPDQYMLWHSSQLNNITHYKNLRIDKLLEDGRQTIDVSERKKIYSDFQKYLLDDPPATFLYFPYVYEIKRK